MCEPGLGLTFNWVLYQARCQAPGHWELPGARVATRPLVAEPASEGAEPPKACLGEGAEMLNLLHRKAGHAREFDDP